MKIKVLANDGISQAGIDLLSQNNYEVITDNVEQEKLIDYINENNISCLLVRSATKVRKDIIDSCKELKLIGRGGVGMDNIDVDYAKEKGLQMDYEDAREIVYGMPYEEWRTKYQNEATPEQIEKYKNTQNS